MYHCYIVNHILMEQNDTYGPVVDGVVEIPPVPELPSPEPLGPELPRPELLSPPLPGCCEMERLKLGLPLGGLDMELLPAIVGENPEVSDERGTLQMAVLLKTVMIPSIPVETWPKVPTGLRLSRTRSDALTLMVERA